MQSAVCNRCPLWARCCLNYGGKACHEAAKEAGFEVKPTNFERIKDMSLDDMATFLSRSGAACEDCSGCPLASCDCPTSEHIEAWKMWLASEVKE